MWNLKSLVNEICVKQIRVNQGVGKGQLISKILFGILNSPKNEQKKIDFTTMIP